MVMQRTEGRLSPATEWKSYGEVTRGTELRPDRPPPDGWPALLPPPSEEVSPICVSSPADR